MCVWQKKGKMEREKGRGIEKKCTEKEGVSSELIEAESIDYIIDLPKVSNLKNKVYRPSPL